jgi:hypothetical protein
VPAHGVAGFSTWPFTQPLLEPAVDLHLAGLRVLASQILPHQRDADVE